MVTLLGSFETGDTVQPVATFRDWAPEDQEGPLVDPTTVTATIYDVEENEVGSLVPVHDSLGVYHADWILSDNPGTYFLEFKGVIAGEPSLNRVSVKVKFAI